ncbi:DNA excision repair protein ERCC-6-like isoform X3 [Zootermopsis nevadensis]|uniref:DNA excision repair protein ERCC-6-like isoform X3 n=1 Tax=Zootermopsis nevadensis TaxID=136037 RepID=UPI000B8E2B1F|nr:DNA excision repair protein ERCC-6-like isoform X3 [Zootermopsis nevadensis]
MSQPSITKIDLQESDHYEDIVACPQSTRSFHIEEIGNSVQVDTSNEPQFANVHVWNKVDQDPDISHTKQFKGYTEENEASKIRIETRKHEVEEMSPVDDSVIFQVDRSQIEEAQLSDEAAELQVLGLSVYDQATLEKGIIQQVDQALEQLDRQQLEVQMKTVADKIMTCKQELRKSETILKALKVTGISSEKQAVSVRKSVETGHKELVALKDHADLLQQKYTNLTGGGSIVTMTPDATSGKDKQQESEREHRIRLGEMTPFGNVLGNRLATTGSQSTRGLTEFEKYLESQAELQKKQKGGIKKMKLVKAHAIEKEVSVKLHGEADQKKGIKRNSPLKKSILLPKKRPKKEKFGTNSSNDWWDQKKKPGKLMSEQTALEDSEGSEYLPSESELEELGRKECGRHVKVPTKKRTPSGKHKQRQDLQEWGTDDSDWDYSDEETRAKRRKSRKKEIDDGNIEDYNERLKLWEEQKARQTEPEEMGGHEIGGGYKLPRDLWSKLYNYQKVGVQWLWELNQQRCGGILGDEMGLGKTVEVIAFLAGLNYSKLLSRHGSFRGVGPSLIVCPTTVMHQWVREFHLWWPYFRVAVLHESGSFNGKKKSLIHQMSSVGCILVTSYVGAVQHQETLLARDWHYVILDEGHKIRNPDAQVTLAVKQFRTPHRLILSGSPMQNNLKELWSLFDFIFPGKLGTLPVFLAHMAVPITQGGYANASEVQVATAYRCATVLRDTIAPYLLRRMKTDVKSHIHLPPKNEQVLFCRLTEEQRSLYKSYLDSDEVGRILQGRFQVFVGLIALRKICNHPDLYSGGPKLLRGDREEDLPEESRYGYWRRAGKMLVIKSLLSIWQKQGHRVLLFTQSRQMLCILEAFVQKQGYKYLKLDGGTGIASRQPLITRFNEDSSYFVFLLTTRVGGLGINLTGADRVVIYDPDWNPATDTQARERAWRIGQQNHVTVYRLVTAGTIEEKVYHRQIFKQFLCNKVLCDPRQRRFFKSNDLLELFTLAESEQTTETAAIFAGTGSEVKLTPKKSKSCEGEKKLHQKTIHKELGSVKFSASKLERMKRLAQLLSKQIASISKQVFCFPEPSCKERRDMIGSSDELLCHPCCTDPAKDVAHTSGANKNVFELTTQIMPIEECGSGERKTVSESGTVEKDERVAQYEKYTRIEMPNEHFMQQEVVKDLSGTKDNLVMKNSELKQKAHNKGAVRSHQHGKKYHKRKHSHREEKGAMFEGERVSFLVGQCEAKEGLSLADSGEQSSRQEDDYVLRKLFKKSGIQTAMRHDSIMEGGHADYALVEGEACRVAKEAVQALKMSRRQCWQADTGVPSWTGQSGALRSRNTSATQVRRRFGKKKAVTSPVSVPESEPKASAFDVRTEEPMTSSELLSRMRARNRLLEPMVKPELECREEGLQDNNPADSILTLPSVSAQEEHVELLTDIRNFVAFGGSMDGRASTEEILAQFSERLPPGSSPLFKFMLSEVCEFHRLTSGQGVWKLRSAFRW